MKTSMTLRLPQTINLPHTIAKKLHHIPQSIQQNSKHKPALQLLKHIEVERDTELETDGRTDR